MQELFKLHTFVTLTKKEASGEVLRRICCKLRGKVTAVYLQKPYGDFLPCKLEIDKYGLW